MSVNPNFAKSQPHNRLCLHDEIVPMRCVLHYTKPLRKPTLVNSRPRTSTS
jgi:hypothetical protein